MIVAAAVAALVAGAPSKTWGETNFKGFKTGGGELGPPVQADSWDACAEECGKEPRCGWIDSRNSETLDCVVEGGHAAVPPPLVAVRCDSASGRAAMHLTAKRRQAMARLRRSRALATARAMMAAASSGVAVRRFMAPREDHDAS